MRRQLSDDKTKRTVTSVSIVYWKQGVSIITRKVRRRFSKEKKRALSATRLPYAWVHKECSGIEEEVITKLQEAWGSSEQKDECTVRLNDLEGAYWMGTEMGQLGAYGFQGVTSGCGRIV